MDAFEKVRQFHRAFRLVANDRPTVDIPDRIKQLRVKLLAEESEELRAAIAADAIVEIADALADLLYVVYGTAVVYGIPIDEVFAEVHRSNMSKLGPDGTPIYRDDGKVQKGADFTAPNLEAILARLMTEEDVQAAKDGHVRYLELLKRESGE